ncbi:MAG: YncE family protein [Planctomycetota bacterium]|jgi:DNA-binding beta-propeller fold protein YncE
MSRFKLVSILFLLPFLIACGSGGDPGPESERVKVDETAPTTVASPQGGDFDAEVEVVLAASEEATIHVSVNGEDFESVGASPARLTMTEGVTTIEYYAVDSAGNIEAPSNTEAYLVDLSPPLLLLVEDDPTPLPWLASTGVEWQSDEECDYVVKVVETDEEIETGKLALGETAKIAVDALDLPDDPITIRIEATDWTGRTGTLDFTMERAVPIRVPLDSQPRDVVILPAGDRAFVARPFQSAIDVLDLDTRKIVETIDVGIRASAMTLNTDASLLYVSNAVAPGAIATINTDSYAVATLSADVGIPGAVTFSADGAFGYFTDFDGSVRVLDTDSASPDYHNVVDEIFIDDAVLSGRLVVAPQGDLLLLNWIGADRQGLEMIDIGGSTPDLRTAWLSSIPPVNAQSNAIVLSADGIQAYISSVELLCGLCRFDLEADKLAHAEEDPDSSGSGITIGGKPVPDLPWGLALLDADERLVTVGPNGKYARLYRTGTMGLRSRFLVGTGCRAVAVSPDGGLAVITRSSGNEHEVLILPLR